MSHFSPLMRISYLSCLSPGLITDINPTANLVFDSAISLLGSYDTSFRLHLSSQDASLGLAVKPPPCCCRLQFGRFPTLCPFRQSAFPWDFVHVSRTKKLADSPKPKPTNSPAAFSLVDLFHYIFLSLLVSFFLNSCTHDACQLIYHLAPQAVPNSFQLCLLQISALSLHK